MRKKKIFYTHEQEKENKLIQLAQTTISILAEQILSEAKYAYTIVFRDDEAILNVKIQSDQMVSFNLSYESFQEEIFTVVETLKTIENMYKTAPVSFKIKDCSSITNWQ